ncbi:MAG: CCA tRNA nucleotidyltransferase [Anaerolineales bacterium]|nr:CCA tRNA nucleotidyltransferase [Anaerolineales bacterium]
MTPTFEIPKEITDILPLLRKTRTWLVGGSVRDYFLQRPTHDFDLVVEGDAINIGRRVANAQGGDFYILDADRNICRILLPRSDHVGTFDIATLQEPAIETNLIQRDFTINALAVDLLHGILLDPTGGLQDLHDHRLNPCAPDAIHRDPIRILRAVRFAVELRLRWTEACIQQVRAGKELLAESSPERIRDELFCILSLDRVETAFRLMEHEDLIDHLLPDISPPGSAFPQGGLETLEWTSRLCGWLEPARPAHAASLLEAEVFTQLNPWRRSLSSHLKQGNASGRNRRQRLFLAAYAAGSLEATSAFARKTAAVAERLRLSNGERDSLEAMVSLQMLIERIHAEGEFLTRQGYHFFQAAGGVGCEGILLFLARGFSQFGPAAKPELWQSRLSTAAFLMEAVVGKREIFGVQPLLDGAEIQQLLNMEPGPKVGVLIKRLREAQALGEVNSRSEAEQFLCAIQETAQDQ